MNWKQMGIMILMLVFLFMPPIWAQEYKDIDQHFAEKAIKLWSERGVIQGYHGQFRPNAEITRGELAVILNRILEYDKTAENRGKFTDLEDAFYTEALLSLNAKQIINGHEGKLRPMDKVTREEAAIILTRAFQLTGSTNITGFTDDPAISNWARPSVAAMAEHGFLKGYQGKVNPQQALTRGELVQILDNMVAAYITGSGEYGSQDIRPVKTKTLVLIKAAQAKIKDFSGNYELIIMGKAAQAIYLKNGKADQIKALSQQNQVMVLLEKTIIDVVGELTNIKFYTDEASTIASLKLPVESLEAGIKKLAEQKIDFGYMPQPGLTDEYKPISPGDSGQSNDSENINHNGNSNSPEQPKPEQTEFWPLLNGLTAKGELYQKIGEEMVFPPKLPILLRENGENTGMDVAVTWSGDGLDKAIRGEKGRYLLQALTTEDVVINQINYGKVKAQLILIIDSTFPRF